MKNSKVLCTFSGVYLKGLVQNCFQKKPDNVAVPRDQDDLNNIDSFFSCLPVSPI